MKNTIVKPIFSKITEPISRKITDQGIDSGTIQPALVLDDLATGLESAWSVGRKLRNDYSGAVIRVRRSSDNAEQDFSGAASTGTVDAAAVAAFCGVGDGFLTTIYDQSGNARHLVQATAGIQPLVVSAGVAQTQNSKLCMVFDGVTTTRRIAVTSSTALYKFAHNGTASTIYSIQSVVNDSQAVKTLIGTINVGTDVGFRINFDASERLVFSVSGTNPDVPVSVTKTGVFSTASVVTVFLDADNATASLRESAWKDGSEMATDNANTAAVSTANSTRPLIIGTNSSGTQQFAGTICELVMWSVDKTANRSVWESSSETFWGTP